MQCIENILHFVLQSVIHSQRHKGAQYVYAQYPAN